MVKNLIQKRELLFIKISIVKKNQINQIIEIMKAKAMKAKRWWRPPGTRLVWGYRMPLAGAWVRLCIPKAMVAAKKPRKAMKAM